MRPRRILLGGRDGRRSERKGKLWPNSNLAPEEFPLRKTSEPFSPSPPIPAVKAHEEGEKLTESERRSQSLEELNKRSVSNTWPSAHRHPLAGDRETAFAG